MKRRVILKKAAQIAGAAVIGTGALLSTAGPASPAKLSTWDANRIQELEDQLADYQIRIEDMKDDRLAAPELLEWERARIGELELALEQARELRTQESHERRKYIRERDAARTLVVKQARGEAVTLPAWAEHPLYMAGTPL